MSRSCDALVIGGGFYGCTLAVHLARCFDRVLLLEQESDILTRASLANQARIHNGYHYPRNFLTALRSFINFPRFVLDYIDCVDKSFEAYYAVARMHSKVSAQQFKGVCDHIGAPIKPARAAVKKLFNDDLIEEVFLTREYAFNAASLRQKLAGEIAATGVELSLQARVAKVEALPSGRVMVHTDGQSIDAGTVYNCTYSGINSLLKESDLPLLELKHEIAEIALMEPARELDGMGITVMDGPFFSSTPFPARGLYSLSHVRYTPHSNWRDSETFHQPYEYLRARAPQTNFGYMIRDAQRYLPCLGKSRYVDSLFEVKTVLVKNEADDGRPILFRQNHGIKNFSIIMGGKIDNIYDILQMLASIQTFASAETVL